MILKKAVIFFVPILFFLATLLSFLPILIGDLFSHFRMFWTVLSFIILIIYIILFAQKKVHRIILMVALLTFGLNLQNSFSFWTNPQTYNYLFFGNPDLEAFYNSNLCEDVQKDTTVKSLLLMNILSSNTNYEEVRTLIENADADFVVIVELNKKWKEKLTLSNYNYSYEDSRENNFGMAFYAKQGSYLETKLDFHFKKFSFAPPCIYLRNVDTTKDFKLIILHPIPPISKKTYQERNDYLNIATHIANSKLRKNSLLVGDLNCSPFSPHYKEFLKSSGLKDSQKKYGFQPTWNSSLPLLLQTPLDHVWHSEDIEILHRQTFSISGSDHKAVLVFFR